MVITLKTKRSTTLYNNNIANIITLYNNDIANIKNNNDNIYDYDKIITHRTTAIINVIMTTVLKAIRINDLSIRIVKSSWIYTVGDVGFSFQRPLMQLNCH